METSSEIGKELKVHDLKPKTVVVLAKEDRAAVTMWVKHVGVRVVVFCAGEVGIILVLFVQPDGTLKDDSGVTIKVHEYLGEV